MAMEVTAAGMLDRMVRAARLDASLYEEVEADTTATSQALTVVVLASLASGIGAAIDAAGGAAAGTVGGLIGGVLIELVGWVVWSYVMFFTGTRLFGGVATYGELLRTLGFAYSPGVLLILRFIPGVGGLLVLAVGIWRLATGFVALRQALDLDTGKTLLTILVGFISYIVVAAIVASVFALLGLGVGVLTGM